MKHSTQVAVKFSYHSPLLLRMKKGSRMKSMNLLAGLFVVTLVSWAADPLASTPPVLFNPPMSQRNANYAIEVSLDAAAHTLNGHERIVWRNITTAPASDAWFHLYLNAFANNQSDFFKESGGRLRGDTSDRKHWGFCRVTSLALLNPDGTKVPLKQLFPGLDMTVMRAELPSPVPPGGQITLDVSFEDMLPKVFARAGYAGNFVMAGQWFPKLGVFQGTKGWNCHAYHANSEFFSDFGVYDVAVTVPRNYVVGSTGVEWGDENISGANKTVHLHAEDVHDFAWTASPDFVEQDGSWEGVRIRILMQPGNRDSIPRYMAAIKEALGLFAKWIWKYPYQQITIVDPPANGMGAAGMEYPTLITGGASPFMPRSVLMPEMVVVHEFGHQYWYGMEANNEFEEAWLDEGINSYYETRIMDAWFGPDRSILNGFCGLHMGDVAMQRVQYFSIPDMDPVVLPAWKYFSNGSYSVMSYSKPVMVLKTLENILGTEKMDEVMRAFFMKVKFTHPATGDFVRITSEAAGRDLSPILGPLLYGTGTIDFKVAGVRNRPVERPAGFDLTKARPELFSKEKQPKKAGTDGAYEADVTIQRKGEVVLPVEILVTFSDKTTKLETWNGEERYVTFKYPKKVTEVVIDPKGKVPLDLSRLNNGWQAKEDGAPASALALRFSSFFEALYAMASGLF